MPSAVVKWFDCRKGFGFLINSAGDDIFVHFSVIVGDGFRRLRDGDTVEYEAVRGPKGLSAVRVLMSAPAPVAIQGDTLIGAPKKPANHGKARQKLQSRVA